MTTWQEDIDKIVDIKMYMPHGPNPRVIKRNLQKYMVELEAEEKTKKEIEELIMIKFKELLK